MVEALVRVSIPDVGVEVTEGAAHMSGLDGGYAIEHEMHRLDRQFRECFEQVQIVEQEVEVEFELPPDDDVRVRRVGWKGHGGSALSSCVLRAVSHHKFARPVHLLHVVLPLHFKRRLSIIEITTDSVTMDGALVVTFRPNSDSPNLEISQLQDLVKQHVDLVPGSPSHARVVIRPLDQTPMRIVDRVIASVVAGGEDYVLAASSQTELPGGCDSPRHTKPQALARDLGRVELSLLILPDAIWLGSSPMHELFELPRDGDEWRALATRLRELRHTAQFLDRTDLEIAGELVSYAEVVKAITVASDVGFISWCVVPPTALSALPAL